MHSDTGTDGEDADTTNTSVTLDAGTGNITLSEEIKTDIGAVALTGATVTLTDHITTDGDSFTLTGAAVLEAAVTVTTANGSVDFSSTINSAEGDNAFTISSGSGDVDIDGAIGGNDAITTFKINDTDGDGDIDIEGITSAGATTIGNADTAVLTFTGSTYTTTAGTEYEAASILMSGTDPTFISDGNAISFLVGDVELANASDLTVRSDNAGDIQFAGSILGSSGGVSQDVTIDAGTGDLTVFAIGNATKDINDISLEAATVTLKGDVVTASHEGDAEDVGSFTLVALALELFGAARTIDTDNAAKTGIPVTFGGTVESDDSIFQPLHLEKEKLPSTELSVEQMMTILVD